MKWNPRLRPGWYLLVHHHMWTPREFNPTGNKWEQLLSNTDACRQRHKVNCCIYLKKQKQTQDIYPRVWCPGAVCGAFIWSWNNWKWNHRVNVLWSRAKIPDRRTEVSGVVVENFGHYLEKVWWGCWCPRGRTVLFFSLMPHGIFIVRPINRSFLQRAETTALNPQWSQRDLGLLFQSVSLICSLQPSPASSAAVPLHVCSAADGADCAVSHLVFLCAGSTPHCSLPSTSEWCDAAFGFLRGENWSTALSHRQKYQA